MRSFRLATSGVSSTSYARPKALLRRWVIRGGWGEVPPHYDAAFYVLGDPDRALASGQRALSIAEALGDALLQVRPAWSWAGSTIAWATIVGRWTPGTDRLQPSQASYSTRAIGGLARPPCCPCRPGPVPGRVGGVAEGIAHGEEGVRIAEAVDRPYSLIEVYAGHRLAVSAQRGPAPGHRRARAGLSIYQVWPSPLHFSSLASALGLAYALDGRIAEALPLLEQAVEQDPPYGVWPASRCELPAERGLSTGRPPGGGPRPRRAGP